MTNMTILDISFFNFWNSTKSMSSEALNPIKLSVMIVFDIPKVILQSREKVKIFNFFDFDHVWSLWTHMYALETWYMLYGHKRCLLVGEKYVVFLEKNICLLVGEEYMDMEDVFLLDKKIWIWKISSCWKRIYECGRCFFILYFHFFSF